MSDCRNLLVWHKAHALSIATDQAAARLRGAKYASLRSQMTRAAGSISANIAEGNAEGTPRQFIRFVRSSISSSSELEHHFLYVRDARILPRRYMELLLQKVVEVRKMLYGLLRYLERLARQPPPGT
jgi:four helix bundle protein